MVHAVVVVDNDDNCEVWEHCANLRSVDRFVGALRNVQRTCSYSSLRTLIILIIVHAIMMIINVITIVIVIMRAKTIRIACVQWFAPYSYSSSKSSIHQPCQLQLPVCPHLPMVALSSFSSPRKLGSKLSSWFPVMSISIVIVFLESITSMVTMIISSLVWNLICGLLIT